MSTQTLNPGDAPAIAEVSSKSVAITPPDAGWLPVAFPPGSFKRWLKRRQYSGGDRLDEVWNGVYIVMPPPNNEHQEMVGLFVAAFIAALQPQAGARVIPGGGITDRRDEWTNNFRCPDVAIYLPGNAAEDRDTHYLGGPDVAVEIVSKGDRSRDKFDFYATVGVRELLYVERRPWALDLYRLEANMWTRVGRSELSTSAVLESNVLPLNFRLIPSEPRPRLELLGRDGRGPWLV